MVLSYADFAWGDAPLSGLTWPAATAVAYIALSVGLAARVRTASGEAKPPAWLPFAVVAHNVVLVASSAAMFAGLAYELLARARGAGTAQFVVCADPSAERPAGPMYFWAYTYYVSKYYELLDTPLQLLRGKLPPNFGFQVYHHALVLVMGWAWLQYTPALWQIGMLFNTAVHVVMYYYFLLCTLGKPPWWKRYVTRFQILQFVTSLACFAWTTSLVVGGAACAGYSALLWSTGFNVTLLYQFVGIANKPARPPKTE
ncbi:ELO family [Pavlovales sp. CCMP2436]|nr:ELO family [Pavlovales sp. CCMP2436]